MLSYYFLRCFFVRNFLFLSILMTIFAACNVFMRLPTLYGIGVVPRLIWAMLPLVAQFALPLSSSLATSTTMMQHEVNDELLIMSFLTRSRRSLWRAVALFSMILAAFYGFLILDVVPQSYKYGKELLLKVTCEHFMQLEPHKFHTPLPGGAFFFKKKHTKSRVNPIFEDIMLAIDLKKDSSEQCFFVAHGGFLDDDSLILTDGSLYTIKGDSMHVAHFDQSHINIARLSGTDKKPLFTTHHKFFTLKQLIEQYYTNLNVRIELHKRIAQIVWQFFLPLLSYLVCVALKQKTFAACIGLCGVLYLLSYVIIIFAQAFGHSILMLFLLYVPLVLLFMLACFLYQKRLV